MKTIYTKSDSWDYGTARGKGKAIIFHNGTVRQFRLFKQDRYGCKSSNVNTKKWTTVSENKEITVFTDEHLIFSFSDYSNKSAKEIQEALQKQKFEASSSENSSKITSLDIPNNFSKLRQVILDLAKQSEQDEDYCSDDTNSIVLCFDLKKEHEHIVVISVATKVKSGKHKQKISWITEEIVFQEQTNSIEIRLDESVHFNTEEKLFNRISNLKEYGFVQLSNNYDCWENLIHPIINLASEVINNDK